MPRKRVLLSLDGGGVRGVIPAIILRELVSRLRAKNKEHDLHKYFDLIVGTSAGAIVAAGLAAPDSQDRTRPVLSPDEIVRFFKTKTADIFPDTLFQKIKSTILSSIDEKYSADPLEKILDDTLKDVKLSESLTNIVITSYDIEKRSPIFMSNVPDETGIQRDFFFKDCLRASTAAPTYFEPARIRCASNGDYFTLVDGGVCLNDPSQVALYYADLLGFDLEDTVLVSIGTGSEARPYMYHEVKNWGTLRWINPSRGVPILSIIMSGQSSSTQLILTKTLNKVGGNRRYIKIDAPLNIGNDDLDDASKENIAELEVFARRLVDQFDEELNYISALL
ncbi:hypothetical protein CN217_26030 [Sinorhizobium meliloti]|uniref:patatin-like phospholipase family protein n=1 Tax=Rhizobium meliloti TaxID=382 RepID=UPI000FD3F737|nr:patatin-like phospholipase family protein [Sinorhizobium meliloti]RVH05454.1 hypothetical protein CN217_26030 [Sinorhizobium meliloti]